ncbi:MAG: hypothetical protein DHS80DRAFT_19901 [Piptocephalis tieghemiana]|nr:MAG: hypothetical protein DHS80DRAFT_19901 [Piptocephalis tieghemiana]
MLTCFLFAGLVSTVTTSSRDKLEQTLLINRQFERLVQDREEAEKANRTKSAFVAAMSHEIRTPLTAIIAYTKLLSNTSLLPDQISHVSTISRSSKLLQASLDNVLDYARLEAGGLSLNTSPFSPRQALEEAVLIMGSLVAPGVDFLLRIDPSIPSYVAGDDHRFRQVLLNLLSNAIKFTHKGVIRISLSIDISTTPSHNPSPNPREMDPGMDEEIVGQPILLALEVRDTGIGIPYEAQDLIFRPFTQANEDVSRRYGGTGLGLVVCKELSRLMQGEVTVESSPGQGSTFLFRAPYTLGPQEIKDGEGNERAHIPPGQGGWDESNLEKVARARVGLMLRNPETQAQIQLQLLEWGMDVTILGSRPEDKEILGMVMSARAYSLPDLVAPSSPSQETPIALPKGWVESGPDAHPTSPSSSTFIPTSPVTLEKSYDRKAYPRGCILYAEDNAVNSDLGEKFLHKLGFAVDKATDGQEAYERYMSAPKGYYTAILMDCQMPLMDGFRATRLIRERERVMALASSSDSTSSSSRGSASGPSYSTTSSTPSTTSSNRLSVPPVYHIPIIAITASHTDFWRQRCQDAGMDQCLPKPLSLFHLRSVLDPLSPRPDPSSFSREDKKDSTDD